MRSLSPSPWSRGEREEERESSLGRSETERTQLRSNRVRRGFVYADPYHVSSTKTRADATRLVIASCDVDGLTKFRVFVAGGLVASLSAVAPKSWPESTHPNFHPLPRPHDTLESPCLLVFVLIKKIPDYTPFLCLHSAASELVVKLTLNRETLLSRAPVRLNRTEWSVPQLRLR